MPTIPDAVTLHYMHKMGINCLDTRVVRIISLATQKFASDIILDCMHQVLFITVIFHVRALLSNPASYHNIKCKYMKYKKKT